MPNTYHHHHTYLIALRKYTAYEPNTKKIASSNLDQPKFEIYRKKRSLSCAAQSTLTQFLWCLGYFAVSSNSDVSNISKSDIIVAFWRSLSLCCLFEDVSFWRHHCRSWSDIISAIKYISIYLPTFILYIFAFRNLFLDFQIFQKLPIMLLKMKAFRI